MPALLEHFAIICGLWLIYKQFPLIEKHSAYLSNVDCCVLMIGMNLKMKTTK